MVGGKASRPAELVNRFSTENGQDLRIGHKAIPAENSRISDSSDVHRDWQESLGDCLAIQRDSTVTESIGGESLMRARQKAYRCALGR